MRKIRVRHGPTVATNQPIKACVDPVGAAAVMCVLQNHLRAGGPDLKRATPTIIASTMNVN